MIMKPNSDTKKATHHLVHLYFFFQAEDGIRDLYVTGVQTCALPIFDVGERRKVHGDVDGEAVVSAAVAHPETERGNLGFCGGPNVNPGRRALGVRGDAERTEPFYHCTLDAPDHLADAETRAPEVEQKIDHELPGTMIGHLAAAIDLQDGNAVVAKQMFPPACESQRIDRFVLGQPELVAGVAGAGRGEVLHRAPRARAISPPEPPHDPRRRLREGALRR